MKEKVLSMDDLSRMQSMRDELDGNLGRIDQYVLVRELGGGGFGTVYLAKDTVSGVEYAVKGLPPEVKNSLEELENIRSNFALVSRLTHTNIARAYVLHPAKEVWYASEAVRQKLRVMPGDTLMVMEYAPGVTLSMWRKQFPEKKVPIALVLNIAQQIASALDYAHERKIVHRDIKPSNVMIETADDGSVTARLLDFGLAAEIRSSMSRVSMEKGDTSGTRPYMAPEQWLGRRQDGHTDQYALACVVYELISGDPPFAGIFEVGDAVLMRMTVEKDEPEKLDELDARGNAVLRKALSKRPEDRWTSCMDFVLSLENEGMASASKTTVSISATVDGTEVADAELSIWDQTITLPAKLEVDFGTDFGPGTVSFSAQSGFAYSGTLAVLHADWFGNKSVVVPLSRTQPPKELKRTDGISPLHKASNRKWIRSVLFVLFSVIALVGVDIGARFLFQAITGTSSIATESVGGLDGSSLAKRMTSAKEKLSGDETMIRDVIVQLLSCISVKTIPGKEGTSPLDLDPKTGEVFVNVQVCLNNEKYDKYAKQVVDKLGTIAIRKETIKGDYRGDKGYLNFEYDKVPYSLLVAGRNLRVPTAEVLWFEKNHADLLNKYIVRNPAVAVFLKNKRKEIIAEGAKYCCDGNSVISWHFITPSLLFSTYPTLKYPDVGPVTEVRIRISLGKFTVEELKDVGKLDMEIKLGYLKNKKFVEW